MIRDLSELLGLLGPSLPPHIDSELHGSNDSLCKGLAYFLHIQGERRLCLFPSWATRPPQPNNSCWGNIMWSLIKFKSLNQLLTITLRPIRALRWGWTQILVGPKGLRGGEWKPESQALLGWRKKREKAKNLLTKPSPQGWWRAGDTVRKYCA